MAGEDYDLIVVGAGSAGCVIASRVARAGRRVLLVEAGPDYTDPAAIPDDIRNGNNNSYVAHDWGFSYRPSSPAPAVRFPRGKVVGGSSAVNTCIALRGEPADYDEWASLAGPEWAWDRCLPAFVRMESDGDFGAAPWHGPDGPLPIRRYPSAELQPVQRAFLDACRALRLEESPDHNQPRSTGFGPTPLNKRGHDRVSAAEAWLTPEVRSLPNLTIRPNALVRRVTFAGADARGVEAEVHGAIERASAREVVLSAGAIMTPPLLVRSGIGPRETLERLSIAPVICREGVGAKLLDHPGSVVLLRALDDSLVDPGSPLMQTCLRTTVRERNDLFVEPLSFGGRAGMCGIAAAVYRSYGGGRLLVTSAEPDACPDIESCFFEKGEEDLDLLVEGIRRAARIASGLDGFEVHRLTEDVLGDDDALRAHARRFSGSGFHPSGTAPMGHADDPLAVCDQYGRVHGLRGLRIADASIMPSVPRANTNVPTLMIGERFAEWLAQESA